MKKHSWAVEPNGQTAQLRTGKFCTPTFLALATLSDIDDSISLYKDWYLFYTQILYFSNNFSKAWIGGQGLWVVFTIFWPYDRAILPWEEKKKKEIGLWLAAKNFQGSRENLLSNSTIIDSRSKRCYMSFFSKAPVLTTPLIFSML